MIEQGATHVGCATDRVIESFRNDLFAGYKSSAGMPRDLLDQVTALCRYRGQEPVITRDLLDAACRAYFIDDEPGAASTPPPGTPVCLIPIAVARSSR